MYYPPLFTSVPRSFDPRGPNTLGGPVVDVSLVGPNHTRENNPLDLTVKPLPHTPSDPTSASISDHPSNDPTDLMMLDHRKLASLAATHSLSAIGRQLGPAGSTATLLDPTLYRLAYGPEAMVPPPFCYDRTTGVAVPTSLTGHQLMASFLQQQQRDRCLEQQQAMFAARTTAAQQAAVAAAAAAFMDPTTLPYNLRTAMTQREAAAALAATRALYPPTMPAPMVLPAFSLYTDDKGAFTSLRNGAAPPDKAYINGNTAALEAAGFAEHLQRIREQHLQQAAKCSNSCCSSLSGLGPTVQCACCIQSPSQAALCARSPMGCGVKDPTTAATASKVCNTTCDFLQPGGLTFLHRPTVTTSNNNTNSELRLPTAVAPSPFCATTTTASSFINNDAVSSATSSHVFHPATSWSSGLPPVSNSSKTAFSVPKKKEGFKEIGNIMKDSKLPKDFDNERLYHHHNREVERAVFNIKREKNEPICDVFVKDEVNPMPQHRREHDVKSLLTPRTMIPSSPIVPKITTSNHGVAHTVLTTVTSTVPTKCEGGTIMAKTTKMPPVLEPFRPVDLPCIGGERYSTGDIPSSISSPQGPPPLIAAANGHQPPSTNGAKDRHTFTVDALRHQSLLHPGIPSSPYKNYEKASSDVHQKLPKKPAITKSSGLPSYVKEEPTMPSKPHSSSSSTLPKPIPHLPAAGPPPHLPPTHYASHYRPYNHLQNAASWLPPAHPNVTVAPPPPPKSTPATLPSLTSTAAMPKAVEAVIKREPDHVTSASNVLQSLLVRPGGGIGLPPPMPGAYPILEYQYHHQHHSSHGLNVAQGGVGPSVAESVSPAAASVAPPLEKPEVKVEGSGGEDTVVPPTAMKYPKKRHSITPTKPEHAYTVPEKKRMLASEFAPVPGYAFQYPTFTTGVKDTSVCPYTFVPEPPGYYEKQAIVPSELRPQKPNIPIVQHFESKLIIKPETKVFSTDVLEPCENDSGKLHDHPVLCPTTDFQIKNEKRTAAARARSKLRKRILARIYHKPRHILCLDSSFSQKVSTNHGSEFTCPESTPGPLPESSIPAAITPPTASTWRNGKLLFKITKRRRIRSGLDMALKRNKKKTTRLIYKMESGILMKQGNEDSHHKSPDGNMQMPAEMRKVMVNKALGETVLHRAARLGYPEVVAYCLETNGGNVNTPDNAGYTPLHECCSRGHLDIARALLQYGADVNASAAGGIRPLHDAVENDHIEVVRLLLSFGADPSIATYSGLTPLKLAHSPLMAEFLQGFMADISGEVDNRPHPAWRFWGSAGCLDPEDNGYDVFDGVPSDDEAEVEGEGDDFLFEVSDSPHLPTFRLSLPSSSTKAQYNFLRLSDVLRKVSMKRDYFLEHYSHIEVLTVPRHEFEASATCSQLLSGSKLDTYFTGVTGHKMDIDLSRDSGNTVDLVRLDNSIRKVLGIETISVR